MAQKAILICVSFPALDRLLDLWQLDQQREVDALAANVAEVTARLKKSTDALQGAVNEEK